VWSTRLVQSIDGLPLHEAERLLAAATGRSRSEIKFGCEIPNPQMREFERLAHERLADTPLQYLEGWVPFGSVEIAVDERVLVPRPETEYLFELIVGSGVNPSIVVDLCTGSGNLATALKAHFGRADVYATDVSAGAAAVAAANARHNGVEVDVRVGDLFDPLPDRLRESVDLVVANPPYLATHELRDLPADVLREPRVALESGPRGDELVGAIVSELSDWLTPEGVFAVEVSEFHATDVVELFDGFDAVVVSDLQGKDRFVMSRSLVE
jgi:release factor glutamine methyltransferase